MIAARGVGGGAMARQAGFSLVELMVSLLLSLILVAGALQMYLGVKETHRAQDTLARIQENGRFVVETLSRDLRRAGFWGGNADVTQILGVPGVAPYEPGCTPGSDAWGRMLEQPIDATNNGLGGHDCASDYLRGDIVTVRYASPEPTENLSTERLYLRASMFAGRLMRGNNAHINLNQIEQIGADEPVVREMNARAYYVAQMPASGAACAQGDNVPGLNVISLDADARPVVRSLAPGVEHLQIQFLDLTAGGYVDADGVLDWGEVIAARIWVLMRAQCPHPGIENTQTYLMGDVSYTPSDNFRRQLFTATVRLRNGGL
ncbi:PilW family protein [Thioalkalivibrio thiocyanodenitrificans]|uniref:PilW family protein n=1 Tax=Thioalkalivibrio thiocyanodenitrificans TaxID=243063 RepID=UPI00035FF9F1|nr:PilW family protein [Thioalkalivibrio thiocyanodenitrificans]